MNKKGFTLIELLVVISIIALLLSIMMPSLGKAKEAARQVMCRTNLKQISLGTNLYVADYDNRLPSAAPFDMKDPGWNPTGTGAWFNTNDMGFTALGDGTERNFPGIGAYVDLSLEYNAEQNNLMPQKGSAVRCPSVRERALNDVFPTALCYGMNFEFTTTPVTKVRNSSEKILFADASWYFFVYDRIPRPWVAKESSCTSLWDKVRDTAISSPFASGGTNSSARVLVLPGRHGKTAGQQDETSIKGTLNALYVDGHIGALNREELERDVRTGELDVGTKDKLGTRLIDNGIKNG